MSLFKAVATVHENISATAYYLPNKGNKTNYAIASLLILFALYTNIAMITHAFLIMSHNFIIGALRNL